MLRGVEYFAKSLKITLKMVPFESLGTVSYSHSIATIGTGSIFSRFDTMHERDRHPATAGQHWPRLCIAACGNNSELRNTLPYFVLAKMLLVLAAALFDVRQ